MIKIFDDTAVLDDGRVVRTGMLGNISIGDSIEVYGDIAIGRINTESNEKDENNKLTK